MWVVCVYIVRLRSDISTLLLWRSSSDVSCVCLYSESTERHIKTYCEESLQMWVVCSYSEIRGDWGPLGHGVHWDTPSNWKSLTYRAHEMQFHGCLVQEHWNKGECAVGLQEGGRVKTTFWTWGISGVHHKLRTKKTIHVFIASVHVFLPGDVGVHWDTQGGVHWDAITMENNRVYA